ncbi:hypothetical protein [Pararhizobium polonicum]|jgi:hypothetical protein|nr:hypothetical protein [Pararhizobium polonicum]
MLAAKSWPDAGSLQRFIAKNGGLIENRWVVAVTSGRLIGAVSEDN